MRISDVMKKEPEYLLADASSRAAARRMRDGDVGFLPICDRHLRVVGMITDRDIAVRVVAEGRECDLPVSDVMSREVVACGPDEDILHAQRIMEASGKSRLVVLDAEGRLAGVVSRSDLTDRSVAEARPGSPRERAQAPVTSDCASARRPEPTHSGAPFM
jgi:CBS domain-containing protein